MSLQTPLYNQIDGTILAGGTLTSSPFNVQGYSLYGLMTKSSSVNGTFTFLVNDTADPDSGTYKALHTAANTHVAITAPSGQFAISSDALTPLKGYQFFHIKSTAQTNGLAITLLLKAE